MKKLIFGLLISINTPRIDVAFTAQSCEQVKAFHEAVIRVGGTDNGAPSLRPHYYSNYYGAFVLDPDEHNIEVVCYALS